MECCETFPAGLPHYAADTGARFKSSSNEDAKFLRSTSAKGEADDDEANDESFDRYYLWSRMIEKYTRTSLTYDKDKLIAVYGLGQFFEFLLRDSLDKSTGMYVAGLWMDILPSQLMWSIEDNRTVALFNADDVSRNSLKPLARRPTGRRSAPSWSWASVVGPVVMPKPLRSGSLIDAKLDGPGMDKLRNSQNTRQDFENVFGFHQQLMLRVTAGRLHFGRVMYLPRFDMWTLTMDRNGFDFRYTPSTASTAGSLASPLEGSESVEQASRPDFIPSGSDITTKKPSGLRGLFKRRSRSSTGATSTTSTGSSSSSQPPPSAVELMLRRPRFVEDDAVHGIGQWDTEGDAKFPPPVPEHTPMPVICLPVINTRNCGKKA